MRIVIFLVVLALLFAALIFFDFLLLKDDEAPHQVHYHTPHAPQPTELPR